jgi:hypothetical protein
MTPDMEPTATLLTQLQAIRGLVEYATVDLAPQLRTDGNPYETLFVAVLFARATTTTEAIIVLSEQGFGQQAVMLNRPLFELRVDAHWTHENRALAQDRFLQHAQHQWHLRRETAARHAAALGELPPADPVPPAQLRALEKLFGTYGSKSWTGLSLHERITSIAATLAPEKSARLWQTHDIMNAVSNRELHPSSQSLARSLRRVPQADGSDMMQFSTAREPKLAPIAVEIAWWTYGELLAIVHEAFELPSEPLHAISDAATPAFLNTVGLEDQIEPDSRA